MKALESVITKISEMNEKQRYYIFLALLVLVFVFDYFVLMRPQIKTLIKINPEISELSDEVKRTENDILRENQYNEQIEEYGGKLERLNQKVKSRTEVPLILERISRIADENGVKIEQIMPQSDELEELLEEKKKTYYSMPILIEARSGYHNFGRFINKLENDDIHLKTNTFVINSIANSRLHSIRLTLLAIIYEKN